MVMRRCLTYAALAYRARTTTALSLKVTHLSSDHIVLAEDRRVVFFEPSLYDALEDPNEVKLGYSGNDEVDVKSNSRFTGEPDTKLFKLYLTNQMDVAPTELISKDERFVSSAGTKPLENSRSIRFTCDIGDLWVPLGKLKKGY
uniref:Uncharacterized protein n=1 Tax=Vespula pensylvanica TaxID=30213 RepID=A0A834PBI6_VESPE|nr:hypothetical protein H0235_002710 [Vespula pensylvanica]